LILSLYPQVRVLNAHFVFILHDSASFCHGSVLEVGLVSALFARGGQATVWFGRQLIGHRRPLL